MLKANNFNQDLYLELITEEYQEFEMSNFGSPDEIKETCDLLYVTAGYLISALGYEKACKAWDLVHASNMAKLDGNIERREDGKVLKSEEWKKSIKAKLMEELEKLL